MCREGVPVRVGRSALVACVEEGAPLFLRDGWLHLYDDGEVTCDHVLSTSNGEVVRPTEMPDAPGCPVCVGWAAREARRLGMWQ